METLKLDRISIDQMRRGHFKQATIGSSPTKNFSDTWLHFTDIIYLFTNKQVKILLIYSLFKEVNPKQKIPPIRHM